MVHCFHCASVPGPPPPRRDQRPQEEELRECACGCLVFRLYGNTPSWYFYSSQPDGGRQGGISVMRDEKGLHVWMDAITLWARTDRVPGGSVKAMVDLDAVDEVMGS